ncbi:MAG TPA: hypothetical protein VMC80_03715 [Patescibacteria group bacterium]|nr:hypothetical protein [Patescibacteria group bacterium]
MRNLADAFRLKISIIKQRLAYDMEPILGYNFFERQREKYMKPSSRQEVVYNIITIPGLYECIINRQRR